MHTDAELFCRRKLRADEIARAFREHIVVIEASRAAVFHKLAHAGQRRTADRFLIEIFPDLIERRQPVKQLQSLHLGQISREVLVEMMVRVDETRIHKHVPAVDHVVCRFLNMADRADGGAVEQQIDVV